ncbi:MAG: hypothetical protein AB1589_30890 [Cyanobacteriota bacterium]
MFTSEELFEYFSDRFSPAQIQEALEELAKHDTTINPEGSEFPTSITERLEQVFQIATDAIASAKQLSAATDEPQSAIFQQAVNLASTSSPANSQVMAAMIRIVAQGAISEAIALQQIRTKVFEKVMGDGNGAIASHLHNESQQTTAYLRELANDDERIDKMLSGFGVNPGISVDAFLVEVLGSARQVREDVKALSPAMKPAFDVDAFLLESGQ